MKHQEHLYSAVRERVVLSGSVLLAALLTTAGFYLARRLADPHWVNRAGAAVVAMQGVAAAVEFARRKRLHELSHWFAADRRSVGSNDYRSTTSNNEARVSIEVERYLEAEVSKSERRAFTTVVCLAVVGEVLHGFGDLIVKGLMR